MVPLLAIPATGSVFGVLVYYVPAGVLALAAAGFSVGTRAVAPPPGTGDKRVEHVLRWPDAEPGRTYRLVTGRPRALPRRRRRGGSARPRASEHGAGDRIAGPTCECGRITLWWRAARIGVDRRIDICLGRIAGDWRLDPRPGHTRWRRACPEKVAAVWAGWPPRASMRSGSERPVCAGGCRVRKAESKRAPEGFS